MNRMGTDTGPRGISYCMNVTAICIAPILLNKVEFQFSGTQQDVMNFKGSIDPIAAHNISA